MLVWLVSGCGLKGPLAFPVEQATLIPCTANDGKGYVAGYMRNNVPDEECFSFLDDPPPSTPDDDPCDSAELYQDPSLGLCGPDMALLARFEQQMSWVFEDVGLDDLTGITTDTADYVECGGDRLDEDGPNTHTTLVGTIEVSKDRGDTAKVEFDLDSLAGTIEFALCR